MVDKDDIQKLADIASLCKVNFMQGNASTAETAIEILLNEFYRMGYLVVRPDEENRPPTGRNDYGD